MRLSSAEVPYESQEEEKRCLNSELWHACAGPLVSLPALGSRVVYFPQGHSEQVTASTNKEVDAHIPNYPSLPPQLICQLHDVTMHADAETDEVYAQMTLQPLSPEEQKETYFRTEMGTPNKQPTNYFCKTLTASDTSTHGGFSVPRRAAEKVFPPLDFSQQPPAQELIARDLHDNEWKFRHIFRGQPKRHLLTTGWSVFVSAKRLVAGDAVIFIWNENNQLLLGIRRANRPQTVMPSSVLSSDSMHIGLLAAAAHAAATNSRFTIFYNPRASPCEFVIPVAKYAKAVYHTRVSIGMRFRMLFETEESSVRRYMGTITGISDLEPARWPNSHWRSVKVGWDESTAGERQPRVSLWDIEPLTTFPMYPSPFPLRLKRPWSQGVPSFSGLKDDVMGMYSPYGGEWGVQYMNYQGLGPTPWMQPSFLSMQTDMYQAMAVPALQSMQGTDPLKKTSPAILQFQQPQNTSVRSASLQPNLHQLRSEPQQLFQNIRDSQNQGYLHLLSTLPQYHKPDAQSQQQQVLQPCQSQQQRKIQNQQHPLPPQQQPPQQPQQQPLFPQQQPPQQPQQQPLLSQQQPPQQPQQHQQQLPQKELHQQLPQKELQHQPIHQFSHQQNFLKRHHQQLPPQKQQQFSDQLMTNVVQPLSQLTSSALQSVSSFHQQQSLPNSNENHVTASHVSPLHGIFKSLPPEEAANLLNPQKSNSQLLSSGTWLPKRIGVDSLLSSGVPCSTSQMEKMGSPQTISSQHSVALPPYPGRDCTVNQDGSSDVQNHLLFGVNIDSSQFLGQSYIANLRNITGEADSTTVPFTSSNLLNVTDMDLPLNAGTLTSDCLEESIFLQSSENVRQVNLQNGAFVKVYKSGSFGRSLDITKFCSYPELRRELGRMFGLEGQLEDPLRSGWQLVFVDRENDILLVGDDPWQEFVNNVWCIKILSPQEVQQMGKEGLDHLNSVPLNRLSSSSCDEYVSRQETRNMNTGITSVGSLDC